MSTTGPAKLYVTFSCKDKTGVGVGRSVVETSYAPRTLSFTDVQAVEKALITSETESLFLTSWQWLADDLEDGE